MTFLALGAGAVAAQTQGSVDDRLTRTRGAEPAKVFDDVYFVGQSEYSARAVTTSAGIILMDAIFDYSVEDEVVNGLKALGLDPAQIKYVVISHAHGDPVGGPASFWFTQYEASAARFRDLAAAAGADVLLSNHTNFDGSKTKIPALRARAKGAPHPYVVGKDAVRRYLTVAEECARAGLASTATATR